MKKPDFNSIETKTSCTINEADLGLSSKPLKIFQLKFYNQAKLDIFDLFSRLAIYNKVPVEELLIFVMKCFNDVNKPPFSLVTQNELLEAVNKIPGLPRKITRQDLYTWRKSNKLEPIKMTNYWYSDGNFILYNLPAMLSFVAKQFDVSLKGCFDTKKEK